MSEDSAVDWGLVRKVLRFEATSPSARSHLFQGICNVLTTRAWMWDHGISQDRKCPCGQEDTLDHWMQGFSMAAGRTAGHEDRYESWEDFRTALFEVQKPTKEEALEGYECFWGRDRVDAADFWWDPDLPVFTGGSALHGLYPGLEVATIGAFQFGRSGTRYLRMRVPEAMRQLPGTAEYLAVEVAARHCRPGDKLHVITDCLSVVQGWRASVWRKDDYRNLAAGFWRLMGSNSPDRVSKVRAHLTKSQAEVVGLCEEWRRATRLLTTLLADWPSRPTRRRLWSFTRRVTIPGLNGFVRVSAAWRGQPSILRIGEQFGKSSLSSLRLPEGRGEGVTDMLLCGATRGPRGFVGSVVPLVGLRPASTRGRTKRASGGGALGRRPTRHIAWPGPLSCTRAFRFCCAPSACATRSLVRRGCPEGARRSARTLKPTRTSGPRG